MELARLACKGSAYQMKFWEINGNLGNEKNGLTNFPLFVETVVLVKNLYDEIFGNELLNKILFFVDNATKDSGYTPNITIVLNKFVIIKLNICSSSSRTKIIFQFSHELTHLIFYAYHGFDISNNELLKSKIEEICTASSLLAINKLFPNEIEFWEDVVKKDQIYRNGLFLAKEINYDYSKLKNKIFKI